MGISGGMSEDGFQCGPCGEAFTSLELFDGHKCKVRVLRSAKATVYGSEGYDLDAAINMSARRRAERSRSEFAAANTAWWLRRFPTPPTRERLLKQADRFGPECVNETAAHHAVNLRVSAPKPKPKRHRRTTPELRGQVIDLRHRGVIQAAIADTLNVSEERVREILRTADLK